MKVQILLSTYNGTAYLKPLMETLLVQDYPDLEILVRDDGSTDSTVAMLRQYVMTRANISVTVGPNVGFVRSFFTLLQWASPAAEYVAFCDQDDVWLPDKVSRAVQLLRSCPSERPALYCSRVILVDSQLTPIRYSELPRKGLSFSNALVECSTGGCTIVMNQAARELVLQELPAQALGHDWWLYLVISAFGQIVYDEEPRILYRKHAANTFGVPVGWMERWTLRLRRFVNWGPARPVTQQAEEFRRIYGSRLSEEHRQVLERFLHSQEHWWDRLRYAFSGDVYRHRTSDHWLLKILIVLKRL